MQLSKKAEDVHARLNSQWLQRRGRGKELSYEKMREREREKDRREGVNFINILRSNFLYESASSSFSLVTFWLCNFLAQTIGAKGGHEMLMKLTQGGREKKIEEREVERGRGEREREKKRDRESRRGEEEVGRGKREEKKERAEGIKQRGRGKVLSYEYRE
jgi:hypothetical protein